MTEKNERTTGAFELCGQTRLLQLHITGQQQLSGDTSAIGIMGKFMFTNLNG